MTTVPGTYFTKEQLETALKVDNVSAGGNTGSNRINYFGYVYRTEKQQYDKALAWYLLEAMENNPKAQNNIGALYEDGLGVPKNYLCALKWYLIAAEGYDIVNASNNISNLFKNGQGVPLNTYKALEWYCHGGNKYQLDRLKNQGHHLSASDMEKSQDQLRKETQAILDSEKKKLEEKQDKTQQEMELLVDLKITYKLTGGSQYAWYGVPILLADDRQRYTKPVISSATNKDQDKTNTANGMERLKSSYTTLEQLLKAKEDTIMSLKRENQMLSTANQGNQQGANEMVDTLKSLLEAKTRETELLKQNMEHVLDKEKRKIKKLLKEIKRLKQTANSRETRPSSSTTVSEATSSNTRTNEDDPNNDFNYGTECGAEYSSSDDTSSEDGDHANDLNYDSDV